MNLKFLRQKQKWYQFMIIWQISQNQISQNTFLPWHFFPTNLNSQKNVSQRIQIFYKHFSDQFCSPKVFSKQFDITKKNSRTNGWSVHIYNRTIEYLNLFSIKLST